MQSQRSSSPQPSPSPLTTMDSENQVVFFADPCSMCGTKKRRVCPLHQKFNPRKKLFAEPSPPPPTLPLFHTNSVYQSTHTTESSLEDHTKNCNNSNTLPLKITPEKTKTQSQSTTQRTGTSSYVGNGTHLSAIAEESSPESQHEASLHNWVNVSDSNARSSSGKGKKLTKSSREEEDFGFSSGTDDESQNTTSSPVTHQTHHKSPLSASKPPRPPNRRQSATKNNNGGDFPVRSPDSETKQGGGSSENNKESWNALKECVGMFNKLLGSGLLNNLQERSPQEIIHQKKGIMELIDSENILKGERGVYKGSCLCSCGKKYQMILSILPE